jgi:hypothetical protein
MANLNQVGIVREEYRDLLSSGVGSGGPTLEEETIQGASKRYGEDAIINVCVSLVATYPDLTDAGNAAVLRDAVEILDYLDTLGMEVRHKV